MPRRRPFQQPLEFRILFWIFAPLLTVHTILAVISGYRAIVQVRSVALTAPTRALAAGDSLHARVDSWARTPVTLQLILVQARHAETLATKIVRDHRDAFYNPTILRDSVAVAVTPAQLQGFHPGPAVLRAYAIGRAQWMRVPPPKVQDAHITIAPADPPKS